MFTRSLLPLLLSLSLAGCASRAACEPRAVVPTPTPPPAPLDEIEQAPPAPGLTWVAGYWHWDDLRWLWVPGHWLSTPRGQRWYPAKYTEDGSGRPLYRPGALGCASDDDE